MRSRRALTLTEILIAAALLATVTVAMLQLLSVTQRQVVSSEALLNTGMLSQLVIDRIKGNVAQNPRWFRDVMGGSATWTSVGTVVDPAVAVNPAGLPLSPFAEHLFAREAPDAGAPANKVAITRATATSPTGIGAGELNALVDSFRDAQIAVEITHDVDLTSATPTALAELVKRVKITVARGSVVAAKGKDPLAFTVTARMATPAESLSDAAYDLLCTRFEPPTLEEQHEQYMEAATDNVYLTTGGLGTQADVILADAFLILAATNNESMLVRGQCIDGSDLLGAAAGAEYLDPWIARLEASGVAELSSSKRERAKLLVRRASALVAAFKRMRLPMNHFVTEVLGPLTGKTPLIPRIRALRVSLDMSMAQIRALETRATAAMGTYDSAAGTLGGLDPADPANAGAISAAEASQAAAQAEMTAVQNTFETLITNFAKPNPVDQETITLTSFLQQFFSDPLYAEMAKRPTKYPFEISTSFAKLQTTLIAHLDQPAGVTPAERVGAAKLLVEAATMRVAEGAGEAAVAAERLEAFATEIAPRMPELARYIRGSEVFDASRAKARHARFVATMSDAAMLAGKYQTIVDYFTGPEPGQTIALWEQLSGLAGGKTDGKHVLDLLKKLMDKIKKKS